VGAEENAMASRRTTFDKLQRERAKKAKAAAKRERRLDKSSATEELADGTTTRQDNPADLLDEIAAVHARYEAKEIDFEEFEELKTDLFERLAALPVES
jgi:hypothetical protein